jgi:predicted DNA-binding transcriptional regulator AlpA
MYSNQLLRPRTVKLLQRLMQPWIEIGYIANIEANHVISNLKNLIKHNELIPAIPPRLLTQQEVADMLSLGLSNFKKLEKEGIFLFKRKTIGGSVRYSNLAVIEYIMSTDENTDDTPVI